MEVRIEESTYLSIHENRIAELEFKELKNAGRIKIINKSGDILKEFAPVDETKKGIL